VRLPIFEGPLDLLLHLIKRNEVAITDIPIATITDQYLSMLDELPDLNLDGAGEYLVMAATLALIKSRMLLPAGADDEPEEDPRAELVQQLVEYQRFREVAVALGEREVLARDVFAGSGETLEADGSGPEVLPVRDASLGDLLVALRDVLKRLRPPQVHEVPRAEYSVRAAVEDILSRFALGPSIEFGSLFAPEAQRGEVIVTFLALLELIRLRVVCARQAVQFGAITLALAVESLEEASRRVVDLGDIDVVRGGEVDDGHGSAHEQ
jgi:segregation and condensation protein A